MAVDCVSVGTDGWYDSEGGTPDNTQWGSHGWYEDWIAGIAAEIIPHVAYMMKRKRDMEGRHIPGLV